MLHLFFLLALASFAASESSYIILAPSSCRTGLPFNISVNILRLTSSTERMVQVKATLSHRRFRAAPLREGKKPNILETPDIVAQAKGTFEPDVPGFLTFKVPISVPPGNYFLNVTGTRGLDFKNSTTIQVLSKSMSLFVQTDKAIYKPGQTVNFRIFGLKPSLKIYNGEMNVEILDPNRNKIKHWLRVHGDQGVYVNKFELSSEPVEGRWIIRVRAANENVEKDFTVEKYVLPKFEVAIKLPSFVVMNDSVVKGSIVATYTYGKLVQGAATVRYSLGYSEKYATIIMEEKLTLDGNTETSFTINMARVKEVKTHIENQNLYVSANVTELLTGSVRSGSSHVQIYKNPYKVETLSSNPKTFKPGLPYVGYIKVSYVDGKPITGPRPHASILFRYSFRNKTEEKLFPYFNGFFFNERLAALDILIPESGIAAFQIVAPKVAEKIFGNVMYKDESSYIEIGKSYTRSENYLHLTLLSRNHTVGSTAKIQIRTTKPGVTCFYQILSRGSIVDSGLIEATAAEITQVLIPLSKHSAPSPRLVVYYVTNSGEIIVDSLSFNVAGVLTNEVDLSFSTNKAQPADDIKLTVRADPGSVAHLLCIDQSVLLLKSGNDITQSQVLSELRSYDSISYPSIPYFDGFRGRRSVWWPHPIYYGGEDAKTIFQNSGLVVLTDAFVYEKPRIYNPVYYDEFMVDSAAGGGGLEKVEHIRKFFPETWLWMRATTGSSGKVVINATVPDTITSWVATAFAVSPTTGLGITDAATNLEVFRPFFVSLNLPYSVVRGEQLILQASVFNYMATETEVLVTLKRSEDFKSIVLDNMNNQSEVYTEQALRIRVPAGGATPVFFPIVPVTLGSIDLMVKAQAPNAADAVVRQLLVEAEGVPKEDNQAHLIDLRKSRLQIINISITTPENIVSGSKRLEFSVIGDILAITVDNLANLLRMPYGCGEQNMLNFAPSVFVSKYLSIINQLTGENKAKAAKYMEQGYQRELNYQHTDGSFSAFGNSDKSGSMWLTAFVVKSFRQAKGLTFIDKRVIQKAILWMIKYQNLNGSFQEPGRVLHKAMQGGSSSGISLSAYVLIALLEGNSSPGVDTAVKLAKTYLESQVSTMTDDYVLAITGYALTLVNSSVAEKVLQQLEKSAVRKDGMTHWRQTDTGDFVHGLSKKAVNVEMSAYVLLSYVKTGRIEEALSIVKWITTMRNSNGGFISTQDTVIALQALSEIAKLVYSPLVSMKIHVQAENFAADFTINKENALILQKVDLPKNTSSVHVTASGGGMGLAEVSTFYNLERDQEKPAFSLTVKLLKETVNSFQIETCIKWLLRGTSGMVVEELGLPTAFTADLSSVMNNTDIKRMDAESRKVIIYFNEIGPMPVCISLRADRDGLVAKSQPTAIRVYDYYQPNNQITSFYQPTALKDATFCDICGKSCGCTA